MRRTQLGIRKSNWIMFISWSWKLKLYALHTIMSPMWVETHSHRRQCAWPFILSHSPKTANIVWLVLVWLTSSWNKRGPTRRHYTVCSCPRRCVPFVNVNVETAIAKRLLIQLGSRCQCFRDCLQPNPYNPPFVGITSKLKLHHRADLYSNNGPSIYD